MGFTLYPEPGLARGIASTTFLTGGIVGVSKTFFSWTVGQRSQPNRGPIANILKRKLPDMVPTHGSLVLTSHPPKAGALSRVRGCTGRPGSLLYTVRDGGSHRAVYSVDSLYFLTFEMRRAIVDRVIARPEPIPSEHTGSGTGQRSWCILGAAVPPVPTLQCSS